MSVEPPDPTRFVRFFDRPRFDPDCEPVAFCAELATKLLLHEDDDDDPTLDHPTLGAGYTYFGQFLAHDVTRLDATGSDVTNGRASRFDLECLYGDGPQKAPWFYDPIDRSQFLIGGFDDPSKRSYRLDEHAPPERRDEIVPPWRVRYLQTERDLQRNSRGIAVIPDPRNDQTVIIAQFHLAMQLAHNALAKDFPKKADSSTRFEGARSELKKRYHHVIVADYLPRVLHPRVAADLSERTSARGSLVAWSEAPERLLKRADAKCVPLEFAFAAFRFGHTLVRPSYSLNEEILAPIPVMPIADGQSPTSFLAGLRPLPDDWTIDWSFFLPNDDGSVAKPPRGLKQRMQRARRFDAKISNPMTNVPLTWMPGLPDQVKRPSPIFATLLRGIREHLPAGSEVMREVTGRFPTLCRGYDFEAERDPVPFYLWILEEAQADCDAGGKGETLGLVASILVFESILAMLAADPSCHLNSDPKWLPSDAKKGKYTLRRLLGTGWDETKR